MEGEWILLDFWVSMFGGRARIALAEKGIEYEYREDELAQRKKSPLLLEMNPVHKKIPVLIHNGRPVCESLNIVQYIDEVVKDKSPHFLPSHPYHKAQARFWADFADKKVFEAGTKIAWHKNKGELEEGKKQLVECLKVLEGALGNEPYFGGEELGYVDVVLGGFCCWFYTYEKFANLSLENECPKLMDWCKRCMNRDSFKKCLNDPIKIYEFVLNERRRRSGNGN